MPLTGTELRRAIESGIWKAFRGEKRLTSDELSIGPNSLNVGLQSKVLEVRCKQDVIWTYPDFGDSLMGDVPIDLHNPDSFTATEYDCTDGLTLYPGRLYLAAAAERVECDEPLVISHYETDGHWRRREMLIEQHFYQVIDGRSTVGRVGLQVHSTAGRGDYSWSGNFTLELIPTLPVVIRAGDELAQIYFESLTGATPEAYSGAYQGQQGPRVA